MKFLHQLLAAFCILSCSNEAWTTPAPSQTHWNASRTWSDKSFKVVWLYDSELVKDDGSILYANCTVTGTRQSKPYHELRTHPNACECRVTLEFAAFRPAPGSSPRACNVNLMAHPNQSMEYLSDFQLHRLGSETALFSWQETSLVRLALVNVTDNCSTKLLEYPLVRDNLGLFYYDVKVYEGSFDLVVSKGTCGTGKCIKSYDFHGNEVENRIKALVVDNGPISGNTLGVGYVDDKGERKNITKPIEGALGRRFAHDYDMLGLCWNSEEKKTHACLQFDQDARVMVNQTFELDEDERVESVHNLMGGGLILLVGKVKVNENSYEHKLVGDVIQVLKISNGGKMELYGIPLDEYKSDGEECFHSEVRYREGDDGACFYFACSPFSKTRLSLKMSCSTTK